MNTQYKPVNYKMIKERTENSLHKQLPLKTIQRYDGQFRYNSKCSKKSYNVFFRCIFCRFDVYLVHDCPISKDAIKFALFFYEFDFQKTINYKEEKCKTLIEENQLQFTVVANKFCYIIVVDKAINGDNFRP